VFFVHTSRLKTLGHQGIAILPSTSKTLVFDVPSSNREMPADCNTASHKFRLSLTIKEYKTDDSIGYIAKRVRSEGKEKEQPQKRAFLTLPTRKQYSTSRGKRQEKLFSH
jgi:hypothetical protein